MIAKFNRTQISSINNIKSNLWDNPNGRSDTKKVSVPEKETFKHIFENAKKGNEMAAVLLDDWHKSCRPQGDEEQQIYNLISKAVNRIFG